MAKHFKKEEHIHKWNGGVCFECGAIVMSPVEFDLYLGEWKQYHAKVKGTKAYRLFQDMLAATRLRDLEQIKLLQGEARRIMADNDYELTKPACPDVENLQINGKVVIL